MKTPSSAAGRVATGLCAASILVLALWPTPPEALSTGWDKTNHLLAFVTLGLLARWGWVSPWRWPALLAFGALIELLQAQLPPRQASWADLAADALGLAVAALLLQVLRRWPRG